MIFGQHTRSMAQTARDSWISRPAVAACLALFSSAMFLYGQSIEEPVAVRRDPVDKPAIPRPAPPLRVEIPRQPEPAVGNGGASGGAKPANESASGIGKKRAAANEPARDAGGGKGRTEEVPEDAIPPEFEKMCPVGRSFYGVRIPSYAGDHLNSVVTSEVMTRVDAEHLDMEKLVIQVYSGGMPDAKIMMDRAIYDMDEEKLTSRQTPPEILHSQFKMVGDKMTFDRQTRVGHMTGNVKMTIFNVESFLSEGDLMGGAGK